MTQEEYEAIAAIDLKCDNDQIGDVSLNTAITHDKWFKYSIIEKRLLNKLVTAKKKLYRELYEYYSGKAPDEVYERKGKFQHKVLRQEIGTYIESDADMCELNEHIQNQEYKIEYIVKTIEMLSQRQWQLKNAMEYLRWSHGG